MQTTEGPSTLSRFGGFWIDRADWIDVLGRKCWSGEISENLAGRIFRFVRDGFVILEQAVPHDLIDNLNDEIESFWNSPPHGMIIETWEPDGKPHFIAPDIRYRAGATKLNDIYPFSATARAAVAAPPAMEFLRAIFDGRPKAFQSLSFWNGSQQDIHKDTAYVRVDGQLMHLAATWLALEDVTPGTGELQYYVGSHRAPDFLFGGTHKWLENRPEDHPAFLQSMHDDAKRYGHPLSSFIAKKGDLLIWHADLAHGGALITQPARTRRSLVTHFTTESDEPYYRRFSQKKHLDAGACLFVSQYADME
jgi:phytanoyl-CoA hydroxylase